MLYSCRLSTWVWTRIAGLSSFVKLFFLNNSNSAAVLREYRRIKEYGRRGALFVPGLKNMIRGFELTGDLGIAPGRGRRPIASEIVE